MNKFTILSGAALLAVAAGVALAQPTPGPRPDSNADMTRQQVIEHVNQRFARMDVNRDGRFTREEGQQAREQHRAQRAEHMFDRLDLNHDGSITRQEMSQAHEQMRAQRGERGERGGWRRHRMGGMHGGPGGQAARGGRMFGEQGFITLEQMRERALARFDRADANHDGTLTAVERQQAHQERIQERRNPAQ